MPPLFRLSRAFHAVSLAATNIASRTTFVVCVPIVSLSFAQFARPSKVRQYPSGNHGSFRAALRRAHCSADHYVVMNLLVTATSLTARFTPIPFAFHSHPLLRRAHIQLSKNNQAIRLAPRGAVPSSPCGSHLFAGRPSSVGVRATSDERNANGEECKQTSDQPSRHRFYRR